jgi:hypothetical protein
MCNHWFTLALATVAGVALAAPSAFAQAKARLARSLAL